MILKPGNPWGYMSGKLSLNPDQAQKMFGFVMNPDAKGVIFRIYTMTDKNGKRPHKVNIISNYFPPSNPRTPAQQANRMKMRGAVAHWRELSQEEKEAYNRETSRRKLRMAGYHLHNRLYLQGRI